MTHIYSYSPHFPSFRQQITRN
uniref:Uncharacterized protein n=1 Tax=Dolichospermum flosaquae TaxID=1166 RepID=Q44041_DOLFA|nr:unknown protein [Dolichospermum flos-aquae]AAA82498.1 unknown protein [Dolichospermum flos-aquae]